MDSGAPADASSSPSANPSCTSFGTERLDERAGDTVFRVRLSTGSSFIVPGRYLGTLADCLALAAKTGSTLDDDALSGLRCAAEAYQVEKKALELLARCEHTAFLLHQKLVKREFSPPAIDTALSFLAEMGWLSDRRFAEEWVGMRLRRAGFSTRKLYADLIRHGVAPALASETIARLVGRDDEYENLVRAAAKLVRGKVLSSDELTRKLLSRGYPLQMIKKYLQQNDKNGQNR